ncbi:hypothetical protein CHS0354_013693 [Potamilus streckersoni]|uniref:Uncharacterized protein n=1 Tax=Potamilus streckersoni TaxID=2493646 RepID=A0AAE0T1C5_9BIVA|nr:hypothetical protein CHS0354_013693 [Potamilus streckersoni]
MEALIPLQTLITIRGFDIQAALGWILCTQYMFYRRPNFKYFTTKGSTFREITTKVILSSPEAVLAKIKTTMSSFPSPNEAARGWVKMESAEKRDGDRGN